MFATLQSSDNAEALRQHYRPVSELHLLRRGVEQRDPTTFYLVGLNLQYRFTPNFSAEVGYNYDKLDSGVNVIYAGSYDRNRVYFGVTGSY